MNSRVIAILVLAAMLAPVFSPLASTSGTPRVSTGGTEYTRLSRDLLATGPYTASPASYLAPLLGTQQVLVIMVYFTDVSPTQTVDAITARLNDTANYYSTVSYDQVAVSWSSYDWQSPWLQLPNDMAYYGAPGASGPDAGWLDLILDSLTVADPYVDYTQYSYVLIVHAGGDEALTGDPNDIWSFSVVGGVYNTGDGAVQLNIAAVSEEDPLGVIAHELGHVFWLPDLYDYSYSREFVGHWALMGKGAWNGPAGAPGSSPAEMISWSRAKLGWIPASSVVEVSPGSSATVYLSALEAAGGIEAVKLPIDASHYYLVEARFRIGYDAYLPGEGVLILYVDETLGSGEGIVRVVDSTPGDGDVDNGQWLVGQSFTDPANNVTITVLAGDAGGYTILVDRTVTVEPPAPAPSLKLYNTRAPPGGWILVEGSGFTPNSTVTLYLDTVEVGSGVTDASGEFILMVRVPLGTVEGSHVVNASDASGLYAYSSLNITMPRLEVVPTILGVGEMINITVSGVGGSLQAYMLLLDGVPVSPVFEAHSQDTYTLRLPLPPLEPGLHVVSLCLLPSATLRVVLLAKGGSPDTAVPDLREMLLLVNVTINVTNGVVLGAEMSAALSEIWAQLNSLSSRLDRLEADLDDLRLSLQELNDTMMAFFQDLAARIQILNTTSSELEARIMAINENLSARLAELNNTMSQALSGIEDMLNQLALSMDQLDAWVGSLDERLARVNGTVEQLAMQLSYINGTVIPGLRSLMSRMNASLQDTMLVLNSLNQSIAVLGLRVSRVNESLSSATLALQARIRELGIQASYMMSQLDELYGRLEELQARVNKDYETLRRTLNTTLAGLKEKIDEAASRSASIAEEVGRLNNTLASQEGRIRTLENRIAELEKELADARRTSATLATLVAAVIAAATALLIYRRLGK